MTRRTLLITLAAIALLGIVDSLYLAGKAMTDTSLFCDLGAGLDGCNIVAQSPYSKLFGVPLAYFGVAFYAVFLAFTGAVAFVSRRELYHAFVLLSVAGVIASAIFLVIQFAFIKALCIYCIISALLAFASLPLTILLRRRFAPGLPAVVP